MRKNYLELPIFATGETVKIGINKILYNKKSDFQDIVIADTCDFGRSLVLDGVMQCADADHDMYDVEMLKLLKKTDRNLLILGGGDGYVAQKALEINPKLKIRVVELDVEVINGCVDYIGQEIFKDERVELYIGDALHYLKSIKYKDTEKFDGIVCDFTGEPITRDQKKVFENFYKQIVSLSKYMLKKDGWIAVQAGDSKTIDDYIDAAKFLEDLLKKDFIDVFRSDISIPSYGEDDAFLFGTKQ